MIILGWILIVIGVLFVVVSFIGALTDILKSSRTKEMLPDAKLLEALSSIITAITKLLSTIFTGPKWFLVFILGVILIYIGARLQGGLPLF
ncbi:MAG: hypothetical protein MUO34_08665 [Ignavibacteriaceae bacterium]|nr:hypothetical protein [Ignavibacteriaceae bacterium]